MTMLRISLETVERKNVEVRGEFFLINYMLSLLRNFPPTLPPFLEMTTRQSLPVGVVGYLWIHRVLFNLSAKSKGKPICHYNKERR
jgi:hypothetical protein